MYLPLLINIVISIDSSKGAQFLQIQIFILQPTFNHSHFSLSLKEKAGFYFLKYQRKMPKSEESHGIIVFGNFLYSFFSKKKDKDF